MQNSENNTLTGPQVDEISATKELLIDKLMAEFAHRGFEGTTLNHLASAAGLSKASLYHHFPGGKLEMAATLIRYSIVQLQRTAFKHLGANRDPIDRLTRFIDGFAQYTQNGQQMCFLAVLSQQTHTSSEQHHALIQAQFADWQDAVSEVFRTAGCKRKRARREAVDLMNRLYGALVCARLHNDDEQFMRSLRIIRKDLTAQFGEIE